MAGLLVLLYKPNGRHDQPPHSRPPWTTTASRYGCGLGGEPVVLPEPLANQVRGLAATGRGNAGLGDRGISPVAVPRRAARPADQRLPARRAAPAARAALRPARFAALFQLVTELPVALLARLLGIHLSVAVAWQRASGGDWTTYAAQVSRRAPRHDVCLS